jgi:single-strand DNA-binding protein
MKDINKVILVGRLGADPIQRQTKTGTTVTSFSVATTRKYTRESDSPEDATQIEETQWHRVVVWGRMGETCAQYLKKGNAVYVEGSIRSRQYESKDGVQKTTFEIHSENISFLGGRKPAAADNQHPIEIPAEALG